MLNQTSKSQRLHEQLGRLISTTEPGDRLPSEPILARELGVSRATLREAMRTYETQGLILRKQGSGTFVVHPTQVIESGLEVLESIETMAERTGLAVSMGKLEFEHRPASSDEVKAMDLAADTNVLHLSRVILADDRPVAVLVDIVPEAYLSSREVESSFTGSVLDLFLSRGTPTLISSRTEINAVTATPKEARKLCIQRGDVLLCLVGYLYGGNGEVVDYSFSYFLPGYFRFHVLRRVR
ncbi:MAG: GntR family transcriptional regulator [Anaerolineales bacterium]|jgi:GntR family transcriptional regulator